MKKHLAKVLFKKAKTSRHQNTQGDLDSLSRPPMGPPTRKNFQYIDHHHTPLVRQSIYLGMRPILDLGFFFTH